LITGATSGLGKALAQSALCGRLAVTGRNLSDDLPGEKIAANLLQDRSPIIDWIMKEVPDIVINNAGFGLYGDACSLSIKEQLAMLEVNGAAVLELTLATAQALQAAGKCGIVLNVSSAAAFFAYPSFAVYAASKAFVRSLSLALDEELRPHGIRVLVFSPGQIATDFRRRASKGASLIQNGMPVEKAALAIWNQIEQKKGEVIFDWKYRLGVVLGKMMPTLCQYFLRREIQKRVTRVDN